MKITATERAGAGLLLLWLLTGGVAWAHADPCKVTIEGNDDMKFNLREISVPAQCGDVEVTLKHSGQLAAKVMGHDWVLAKESDMSGIVSAGLAAGVAQATKSADEQAGFSAPQPPDAEPR